ncbi:ribonuclease H-like domain-containing protein [Tanacetum coccineum]
MTGNKAYLDEFQDFNGGPVAFGGSRGYITGKGKIKTGKLDFEDVCFVKELQHFNLFSVSQICDKKNKVLFTDSECLVLSPEFKLPDENQVLLKIPRQNNMYSFNLENIVPTGGLACLIAKATTDESNKWHMFSWVFFLRTKDETSAILKDFIRQIENQLNQKVKTIRSDNGTEFKNKEVIEFCGIKGIKREYSNARTPQQNGVAERKNRTLIEAARTMLADSFLPNTFWAEAVSTACYVLNRVLVTKPHNKTPYELLTGKIPIISYIRPFGCHVTILNTIDHLGKFAGKSDEGFLVGYSLQSKAFRVYNLETKRVEENLHITFLENKPNVAGKGPTWLFDLDYLTDSMNYHPVSSENQANLHAGQQEANQNAGTEEIIDVGDSDKEDDSARRYCTATNGLLYSSTITPDLKTTDDKRAGTRDEEQVFMDDLERLKKQEKEAYEEAEALRKKFETLVIKEGAAKPSSTNIFSTVSTPAKASSTNLVNTVSLPVSTASPHEGLSLADPTHSEEDDSEIPPLEDIYQSSTDGIFTTSSFDDEGAVADFTNLETVVNVSPIPTSRIHSTHPRALILGDPNSAFWTSAKSKTINNVRHITAKVAGKSVSISEASIRSDLLFDDADGIDTLPNQDIFDAIQQMGHLDAKKKFVMYPRFISIFLGKQLVDVSVPLDHFPVNTLTSKVFSFMVKKGKHFSGKVTPLFATMLVQPTQDEGASSERPSEALPTPSPAPTSEVPYEPQTDSSPAQTSEVPIEHQSAPSPRPSPTTTIPDSIPETSGENLGGYSSSDKSLLGNEGDMTIQGVYDLCLSLCKQVSDQAKEIQVLKAQITKLKKQAKPVIKHHKAYLKSVSLKQRFPRKSFSKKHRVHKESISKQGRKIAKGESSVKRDPLFDVMPEDTIDHMETENAQSEGRSREMVDEDKELDERILSTEDVVSTDKEGVSTDIEKVSTDGSKVSTDEQVEGTEEPNEGTDENLEGTKEQNEDTIEIFKGTEEQREGTEEKVESTDGQIKGTEDQTEEEIATQATQTSTQTPTSMIFRDDETIATVLLNISQAKAVSKEKEKGVELKDVEETDRPRPTSTRSLLTLKPLPKIDPKDKGKKKIEEEDESESESDGIPQAEKKFKQLESDEELARKVQEEWEAEEERNRIAEENAANEDLIRDFDDIKARIEVDRLLVEKLKEQEREQFTIEERAKFLHDTIAAQRKFLAQQRSEAIRNKPPTKNQLRNQMMTYLKHVGNYKHAELKIKKFEEVQALYEKIKRSDEDFISIGSAEDERLIKRMNEKGVGLSKSEVIKEENKEEVQEENKDEESTRKRKLSTRKKMKSRKRRYIQYTSEDDSDKENYELRLYLTIAQDEEKEMDYEILDKKYPIKEWKTECLGAKP